MNHAVGLLANTDSFLRVVGWSTLVLVGGAILQISLAYGLRARNAIRAARWNRLEAMWEPMVLDVLEATASTQQITMSLRPRDGPHFLRFLTRYARLLTGADRDRIIALAAPLLHDAAEDLNSALPARRAVAVQTLATLGLDRFGRQVVAALDDGSPQVAMVAARSLAASDRPEFIDDVLARLERFSDWNSRFLASMIAALGPSVAPALRAFLGGEQDPKARVVAAETLRLLTDPAAAEIAADIVARGDERELVAAGLRLIAAVGGPDQRSSVRSVVDSEFFALRAHALAALGTIGQEDDHPLLAAGLNDPSPWVALHAARSLAAAGRYDLLERFAELAPHRNQLVREVTAGAGT